MFVCASCEKAIGPRVKPITRVTETRVKHYEFQREDADSGEVGTQVSVGSEIVKEVKLCASCAEVRS